MSKDQVTKQKVRNLNNLGPRPKKNKREGFGNCLVGRHEGNNWRRSEVGNWEEEFCANCDLILTDNAPENEKEKL